MVGCYRLFANALRLDCWAALQFRMVQRWASWRQHRNLEIEPERRRRPVDWGLSPAAVM